MKYIYRFLIFFLVVSCNFNEEKVIKNKATENNITIKEDSLSINIDNSMLSIYLTSTYFQDKYYGYNSTKHSLDIFTLNGNKENIKTFPFEKVGPNGFEKIQAIDVVSKDSLFMISENYIYLIDGNGVQKKKVPINYKSNDPFFDKKHFYVQYNSIFKYDRNLNRFFITTVDMVNRRTTSKYYKNNIVSVFDFDSKKITDLKLKFPQEYISDHYGFNDFKYFTFNSKKDSVIYMFSALDDVFSYNIESQKTTTYQVIDNLPNKNTPTLTWSNASNLDEKFKKMSQSSNYGPILSSENYIYRFYQEGMPQGVNDFSLSKKRKKFISLFDKNLNLISEYQISTNRINQNGSFLVGDDLYIPKNDSSENELSFLILKIH